MKENIDLTDNMLFSRNANRAFENAFNFLSGVFKYSYPWDLEIESLSLDDDLIYKKIIPTGNKENRRKYIEIDSAVSRDTCDRCGDTLVRHPWNRTYGLCTRCHMEMQKEEGQIFPWNFREERTIRNGILRAMR